MTVRMHAAGRRMWSIVVLAFAVACDGEPPPPPPAEARQSTPASSPAPRTTTADAAPDLPRIPLPVPPKSRYSVAIDDGLAWLVTGANDTLTSIDLGSGQPAGPPLRLELTPVSVAAGAGSIWVVAGDHRTLLRIDPETRETIAVIDITSAPFPDYEHLWVAAAEGYVWLVGQRHVLRIDPRANVMVGRPIATGEEVITYSAGAGSFWTGSHDDGILARIDPATGNVMARIDMGFSIHGLAFADGAAWVLDEHGYGVVRVDPATNRPGERIPIDFVASNLAAGNGSVWVAAAAHDDGPTGMDWIARVDIASMEVVQQIRVGGAFKSDYFLALYQDGAAWAVVHTPAPYLVRLDG